MIETAQKKWIQGHEGYRDVVYLDSLGKPTCGWGHLLAVGSKVPLSVSQIFFERDFQQAKSNLQKLIALHELPDIGPVRMTVLLGMLFQMGLAGVLGFKKMLAALQLEDFKLAAAEMLDSKWAKSDSPERAKEAAQMMRAGSIK